MKTNIFYTTLVLLLLGINFLSAQPFTLDKNIKPIRLGLTEHPKYEGAKYIEGSLTLKKDSTNYHYVEGHDIYQYVDIFIYANDAKARLQADVVYNSWNNIEETQKTSTSENGFINFKLRSYQDIGFTVKSEETHDVPYSIVVNASPEVMHHLGSPFVKATETTLGSDSAVVNSEAKTDTVQEANNNLWIYIVIGVLLLVVGLLAGKLMGRKNTMLLIVLLTIHGVPTLSYGQTVGIERARESNLETEIFHRRERNSVNATINGQIDARINTINKAFATADALEEYIRQYRNVGSCLGSAPPPGQPRIPSFCNDEDSDCADCFRSARAEFNRCRYNLERLQTIYNCSKAFTDAAVALGDNTSGYHGVVGIVWQSQRRGIMRSIDEVDKAYDSKRIEMLESFHNSLMALDACERAHGLEDWYDRFGVMFYNFVEMRYHR
ncbi:hypothetical protein H8K90_12800 [Winogradskyella echinorum]|uniref:Uncharacterized protein n=1 Tax=Winogradskyella echinorum TaxID=538189 RepID=A0ABR6Y3F4_9FLAO|nr:hypothetical protein [Winogradskyella echinorum]MBC3847268.1 hypothetical protein [Winogradskyella echinorum]MBC5751616.1 hypothetical protein [Winogradskyella echinorum]